MNSLHTIKKEKNLNREVTVTQKEWMTSAYNTILYNWNLLREQNLNVITGKKVNMWGNRYVN